MTRAYVSVGLAAILVAGALVGSGCVHTAYAETPIAGANLNTPESPASAIIGASTKGIQHPGSPVELGAALLDGLDVNGNLKTGVGVEGSPVLLLMPVMPTSVWVTPRGYQKNRWDRLLARTSISLASAKGASSADNSVAVGIGLRTVLIDQSDPALDGDPDHAGDESQSETVAGCFKRALDAGSDAQKKIAGDEKPQFGKPFPGAKEGNAVAAIKAAECLKKATDRLWNRSAWDVALAKSFVSPTGPANKLKSQTYTVNTTVAWGFDKFGLPDPDLATFKTRSWWQQHAQLLVGIQYADDQLQPDPDKKGSFFAQNSWQFGGQFRLRPSLLSDIDPEKPDKGFLGNAWDTIRSSIWSFEAVYIAADPRDSKPHSNDLTLTWAGEIKLGSSTYLDLGIGADRKGKNGSSTGFALTQLRYNLGDTSTLFMNP